MQPAERLDKAAARGLNARAGRPVALEKADDDEHEHEHGLDAMELARIGLVAIAVEVAVSWSHLWRPVASFDVVAWGATIVGGYPVFKEAMSALLARRMTMELSMTIALAAALSIGEPFTALVIVLFVLVAEVLEHLTVGRGRKAIRDLMDFLPRSVSVRREHGTEELAAAALHAGDVVVVKPGGRVPVDGEVVGGHSFVDQAMVTGESLPVEKTVGATVFAGTVNQSGVLEVRATGIGKDTAYARIIEAVERAERTRAPIQTTADRLAGYLVYFALAAAVLTFLITRNARATISVVIVAEACGIAAGTPLAILGAIGRAARLGAIIKGGIHLESLGHVDTIVLDKTGTLTLGTPQVAGVHVAPGVLLPDLMRAAATAESASEHPLAAAVLAKARAEGVSPGHADDFTYTPGRGIVCSSGGEAIIVGNLALLRERGVVPESSFAAYNIHVAVSGKYFGAFDALPGVSWTVFDAAPSTRTSRVPLDSNVSIMPETFSMILSDVPSALFTWQVRNIAFPATSTAAPAAGVAAAVAMAAIAATLVSAKPRFPASVPPILAHGSSKAGTCNRFNVSQPLAGPRRCLATCTPLRCATLSDRAHRCHGSGDGWSK